MPVRTKAWLKLGALGALVVVLTTAFVGALDLPRSSHARESAPLVLPQTSAPRIDAEATRPAADLSRAFIEVSEAVRPAVVFIRAERRRAARGGQLPEGAIPPGFEEFFRMPQRPQPEQGNGSGFIVSENGYILTNHHVVAGAEKVTVRLLDRREFSADVVGSDELTDVAVVKIDATDLPTVPLADSDGVRIGEWVLAVGNPLGEAFTFTVTAGIVSQKGRQLSGLPVTNDPRFRIQDFIQTDAAINPGNSGGPLVNLAGEAIGINSAIASPTGFYQGYGFAIPSNLARAVMEQLIETGHVRRSVIGVLVGQVDPEAAEYVGLEEITGVLVEDFSSDDSPAKRAGIQRGDVIIAVDGQPIEYVAQLQQIVGFKRPGEKVRVTVQRRGGGRRTLEVRLVEAPTEATLASRESEPTEQPTTSEGTGVDRLGVHVRSPTASERRGDARFRELGGQGVLVTAVDPDGPAGRRLLPQNARGGPDVIVAINDMAVSSEQDVERALRNVPSGAVVRLDVYNYESMDRRMVYLRAQ